MKRIVDCYLSSVCYHDARKTTSIIRNKVGELKYAYGLKNGHKSINIHSLTYHRKYMSLSNMMITYLPLNSTFTIQPLN